MESEKGSGGIRLGNVGGDVVGVGVSGSGNIIAGKNSRVTVIQQVKDEEKLPTTIIVVNHADHNDTFEKLANALDVRIYEENRELIPFILPEGYNRWKERNKLFFYGVNGCGKSRSIFEIIKFRIDEFQRIYILNSKSTTKRDDVTISQLVQNVKDQDAIIWDNFPDPLYGESAIQTLEKFGSTHVKNIFFALQPDLLES